MKKHISLWINQKYYTTSPLTLFHVNRVSFFLYPTSSTICCNRKSRHEVVEKYLLGIK